LLASDRRPHPHHLVFVYGTLLRGERNHGLLVHARLVGPAATEPRFELIDLGAYPGMTADGQTAIRGELYEVDDRTLARLDELEGHPRYYRRETIALDDGRAAHAYVLPAAETEGCPPIASGDWKSRAPRKAAT
jgi:gamma-glutamylcyclotransferase (GGCT)/AIG2-like uncharacterized protein YtfP